MRVWWRARAVAGGQAARGRGDRPDPRRRRRPPSGATRRPKPPMSRDPDIRLPRTADLTAARAGARLLRRRRPRRAEPVARPARGRQGRAGPSGGPGLAAVEHRPCDLWVDPATGVPLAVAVHAAADGQAAFTSEFREFSDATPDVADNEDSRLRRVREVELDDVLDIADAANQYAHVLPPATLAGLEKSAAADRAVGVYGAGVTQIVVIPLRDREARAAPRAAREAGRGHAGARGRRVERRPAGCPAHGRHDEDGWLLAGTVTEDTLATAARELVRNAVYFGHVMIRTPGSPSASAGSSRSTTSTSTCARATSTASSAPTGRARPRRCGCCWGWCSPRPGRSSCWAGRCRSRAATVLPQVGALVEGPAAYPHLSGRANLALFDAMGPAGATIAPAPAASTTCSTGRARRRRQPAGAGLLARHAAAARPGRRTAPPAAAAGARRADQRPGPAGHPRDPASCCWTLQRSRHDDLPVQPSAGRGRADVHPGRGARPRPAGDAGAARRTCSGRPAGSTCGPGRRPGARACSTARSSSTTRTACSSGSTTPPP